MHDDSAFAQIEALKDTRSLLDHLLRLKDRQLTESQTQRVLGAVEIAEEKAQTPLMMTILANWVARWRSFDEDLEMDARSVRTVIVDMLERLKSEQGKRLVEHVLSFITLAKEGISETELQETLSLVDDVLAESFAWYTSRIRLLFPFLLQLLTCSLAGG